MIEWQNFSGVDIAAIPPDSEYRNCNFMRPQCIDDAGQKKGVRLFPGDDTPRTFINCNMVNCEPPPGSTLTNCNRSIIERHVVASTETVTIDGVDIVLESKVSRKHAVYNPETESYDNLVTPIDIEEID